MSCLLYCRGRAKFFVRLDKRLFMLIKQQYMNDQCNFLEMSDDGELIILFT